MKFFILKLIRLYQRTISPDHGGIFVAGGARCRFYPSCSEYTHQAVERFGIIRGVALGSWRILRCNPLTKGGVDLV